MKKQEFLQELKNSLEGRIHENDTGEIIEDYGDIFEQGLQEGDTEEGIALKLGSPALIACTILEDIKSTKGKGLMRRRVALGDLPPMWKRFTAYIIDWSLLFLIGFFVFFMTSVPHYGIIKNDFNLPVDSAQTQYICRNIVNEVHQILRVDFFRDGEKVFSGSQEEYMSESMKKTIRPTAGQTHYETMTKYSINTRRLIAYYKLSGMIIAYPLIILGLMILLNFIIAFELWVSRGYTLGKFAFGIKVVCNDGRKIGCWDAILREVLIKFMGGVLTVQILTIGSFVAACITPDQITAHDYVAKTQVISVRR